MPRGQRWSRDELLIAMNLYCRLPFGQFDKGNALIIRVAEQLVRSPSSVGMKLCNLASLDPEHRARGVWGLRHASAGDRAMWEAFHDDWERMAVESEAALEALLGQRADSLPPTEGIADLEGMVAEAVEHLALPDGPTEVERTVSARRGQRFFRNAVLASYDRRCAITGLPVPELLNASHILPWAEFPGERVNPRNGICLAVHFDRAFDRGFVTFDEDSRLVVSRRLREYLPNEAVEREFMSREGEAMRAPERFQPPARMMAWHREHVLQS